MTSASDIDVTGGSPAGGAGKGVRTIAKASVKVSGRSRRVRAAHCLARAYAYKSSDNVSSSKFGDQLVSHLESSASPRSMQSSKCCQLSKTIDRVQARISSQKVWRRASTRRSNAYWSSRPSNTVWHRKASRVRRSKNADRDLCPGPQWCAPWSPVVLRTWVLSFALFHRPRPACATAAPVVAVT